MTGIFTGESDICWSCCSSLSAHLFISPRAKYNAYISQAANGVRNQDKLVGVFERIESFFHRLEVFTDLPPTAEMMNAIIQIIIEVILILGIVTREIKQGRMSE